MKIRSALCHAFLLTLLVQAPLAFAACGINWQASSALPNGVLGIKSVTYGNGQYVATADYPGGFLTSPNGISWTWRPLFGTQIYNDVTWGGNQFVAVKQHSTSWGIATSPNGTTWTLRNPNAPTNTRYYGIAWNGKRYVAVGGFGTTPASTAVISISNDGRN
jgi:hypothetical protein